MDGAEPASPSAFLHGVASGDPTPRRVVLWTRLSGFDGSAPVAVRWRVVEAEGRRPAGHGQSLARADGDWTVRVDVGGLQPDTRYEYDFEIDDDRSTTGHTRTLPDGDPATLRFAQVSCAKYNAGHFNAYARLAARDDIAFVLHLGDWIYEASQTPPASQTASKDIGRPFEPLHECVTLADYRTRYAQSRRDPDVQAVSAAHPFIATVDDHEFADGAWRGGADNHDAQRDGPWADRKAAAFRAREEWLPIRRPDPSNPARVYRSVPIGSIAEIFLLDTRTMRDEPVPPPEMLRMDRTELGADQKAWLFEALRGFNRALAAARQPVGHGPDVERRPSCSGPPGAAQGEAHRQ
jgi:alkaline phosphatase D